MLNWPKERREQTIPDLASIGDRHTPYLVRETAGLSYMPAKERSLPQCNNP